MTKIKFVNRINRQVIFMIVLTASSIVSSETLNSSTPSTEDRPDTPDTSSPSIFVQKSVENILLQKLSRPNETLFESETKQLFARFLVDLVLEGNKTQYEIYRYADQSYLKDQQDTDLLSPQVPQQQHYPQEQQTQNQQYAEEQQTQNQQLFQQQYPLPQDNQNPQYLPQQQQANLNQQYPQQQVNPNQQYPQQQVNPNQQYPQQQQIDPNQQYPQQQVNPNQQYPQQIHPNQQYPQQQVNPNQQYPQQQVNPNQQYPQQINPNQQYPQQQQINPNQQYPQQQQIDPNQQNQPLANPATTAPETFQEVDKLIQQIFRLNVTGILDQSLYLTGSNPVRSLLGGVLKLVFCDPISRLTGKCRGNDTVGRRLNIRTLNKP